MSARVVVVGSSNIDLVMKMARLPRVGETVTDATFVQAFGGKGANQAVGAARAGGEVAFVGCVGDDAYGQQVRGSLEADGIDTRFVFTEPGVASGTALILVGGGGENYISVAPGANDRLTPAHVDRAREAIEGAAIVVTQCEIPPETIEHVVALGAELGKPVLLNLAPARRLSDAALSRLTLLAVNETEAESLTGRRVASDREVQEAAGALLAKGPRTVVLTLGARGAYVGAEGVRSLVPGFAVEAVDTTAAGDVHGGALAVALVEGRPVLEAVRFANAAAALSVTRLGAQPSAPRRSDIETLLSRG
ncbi:MAG TPA: ribokinase [Vicinamibacteria bacterium]|nr:ribokinase [Vicinamibacteria bacterium]